MVWTKFVQMHNPKVKSTGEQIATPGQWIGFIFMGLTQYNNSVYKKSFGGHL